jgi:hypothetical protein
MIMIHHHPHSPSLWSRNPIRYVTRTAETAGQPSRRKEISNAEGDFALRVEESEVDGEAGKEAALDLAEQDETRDDGAVEVAEASKCRNGSPLPSKRGGYGSDLARGMAPFFFHDGKVRGQSYLDRK